MYIKEILVVDDELLIRNFVKDTLKRQNKNITLAQDGKEAIGILSSKKFDLVITDIKMPHKTGMDVLKYVKEKDPTSLVIIMSAFGTFDDAVEALNLGAFNYLLKPFSPDNLEAIIKKAEEYLFLVNENRYLRKENLTCTKPKIVSESSYMKKILQDLAKISQSNASVFISGESGTGKEVIAELIHKNSNRAKEPFIKVNCAAIPETLLESEFFGHEKGSFTGAVDQKKGRFELANNGTLLLDEITEIPLSLQPKLLRAIQEQEFERVGGTKSIKVNVRFISTSNRNIKEAIEKNLFREDLFYRLNVMPIELPPLRERSEDIISLATFFLEKFSNENNKTFQSFSNEALEKLVNYPWPGNIRELANVIERVVVLDQGIIIEKEHILLDQSFVNKETSSNLGKSLEEVEKNHILQTLEHKNFNKTHAAKELGVSLRTLRNKLNIYNKI